mmetsp:Transcript_24620/g.48988  ORF Transcript_24620/g.48988 Transcript_24620/m.48988 type:complete len:116 (-) Transcript_24620:78-425(-)
MVRILSLLCAAAAAVSPAAAFGTLPVSARSPFVSTSSLSMAASPIVKIVVNENEPIEMALRRFKREVNKSSHLMELRHRRHFENSVEKKKRKIVQARNRKKFERMQKQRLNKQKV